MAKRKDSKVFKKLIISLLIYLLHVFEASNARVEVCLVDKRDNMLASTNLSWANRKLRSTESVRHQNEAWML